MDMSVYPSIGSVKPIEEGGPIARNGFKYQDHIAVGSLIEMLDDATILQVHCETYDDIVIERILGNPEKRWVEYVQVKAHQKDSFWSVADICRRKKAKNKSVPNTSIFETSLSRDQFDEHSLFRLVTVLPVVSVLEPLTFPIGSPGREANGKNFTALQAAIDKLCPGVMSTKQNGSQYWLENCVWDIRHSEKEVQKANIHNLLRLGVKEHRIILLDQAEILVEELLVKAKEAGDAKWEPDRDKKIIPRISLREWWERRTRELEEGATMSSGDKLKEKLGEAELSEEVIRLALDMRIDYARAVRETGYMSPDVKEKLKRKVKSELMSLRSSYISGQINLDGREFHALCLQRLDKLSEELQIGPEDRDAFLKGCMYDITDRCLHRFARPTG